ncbi:hypothetical protein CEXT_528951, partial [Caerostris extrusa]
MRISNAMDGTESKTILKRCIVVCSNKKKLGTPSRFYHPSSNADLE